MLTRSQWATLERTCRIFSVLCRGWLVILILALLASPVGPHLRIDEVYGLPCTYVGSRGVTRIATPYGCPILLWHDRREG